MTSYFCDDCLPCPFCGGTPIIKKRKTVIIECQKCGALFIRMDELDAVQCWNNRVSNETIGPGDPDYPETLLMCYLSGQMSEQQWQEHQKAGEV